MQVPQWEKYLSHDWDPELFSSFLVTFPLDFKTLEEKIQYAVNHDTNIESIIEQGLAYLDDNERKQQKQQKKAKSVVQDVNNLPIFTWRYHPRVDEEEDIRHKGYSKTPVDFITQHANMTLSHF